VSLRCCMESVSNLVAKVHLKVVRVSAQLLTFR
jgi:hypothetical protein